MTDINDDPHRLMAYADGELDAAASAEVERLIAVDPHARARVALYRDTAAWLTSACGEAVYGTRTRAPVAMPSRRRAGLALAASVGIALTGFGLGRWLPQRDDDDLLSDVAEYHRILSRETTHLTEMPAGTAPEGLAWLGARLGRRLVAPDLAAASLRFAGVRLLVIEQAPVADLLYTRDAGPPVGLCIARTARSAAPIRLARRDGLQLAAWRDAGYAYAVVGDLDPAAARDIAERAGAQLRA